MIYEENTEIVVFFIRGNDELEEIKACNAVDALEIEDASEEDIKEAGLCAGYCGPFGLAEGIKFVVDSEIKDEVGLVCGANEEDYHLTGTDLSTLKDVKYFDLIAVQEGDSCSCCGGSLYHTKGIETGHIFQLGTKYSEALDANFLDQNGKTKPFEMGTYGIGVSRLVATIVEQHHDEKGCIWTKETTPYMVDVIVSNAKKEEELAVGTKIYDDLKATGIDTILDDRLKERFGFKMGDYELLGFPYAVIVGKKLQDGVVEIVDRKTLEKTEVLASNVQEELIKLINA